MKIILSVLLLLQLNAFSQTAKGYEQKLNKLAERHNYWDDQNSNGNEVASDSLEACNNAFEKYLLEVASTIPESISNKFEAFEKNHIHVLTSEDGNFRIYTWDTFEGGTMRFFKNILQYKSNGKVKAKVFNIDEDDAGCQFLELNQVTSNKKHFYVTCAVSVGSSSVYGYYAKIFSIDNRRLNEEAKLIKTKSGLMNTLYYEIDLTNEANRNDTYFDDHNLSVFDYIGMEYDKKTKTIILALLDENEKVTTKKIKYRFNGTYFEKVKQ